MTRWEYKVLEQTRELKGGMFEKKEIEYAPDIDLEALGQKGWELIAVVPLVDGALDSVASKRLRHYFKRPA